MRKGIIQMQESILVTFFIIVIIAIGLIMFYRFSLNSLNNYEQEYREQQLLSFLMTMPSDVDYVYLGDSRNAVDTSKIINSYADYGFRKIYFEQIYPEQEDVLCNIQNYPNCNYFVFYDRQNARLKNKIISSRPVSLYYPLTDEYKPGKLVVEHYY